MEERMKELLGTLICKGCIQNMEDLREANSIYYELCERITKNK